MTDHKEIEYRRVWAKNAELKAELREQRRTSGKMVYCVRCCYEDPKNDVVHIFSTAEKAQQFADQEPTPCVLYDYVIDVPERMDQPQQ